jgi:hypothetical protein
VSEPIWSKRFAQDIGKILGFPMPETAPDGQDEKLQQEGMQLVEEVTEDFRYLHGAPVNWVFDLARFLARDAEPTKALRPYGWPVEKLRELREYQRFLRQRHGTDQPADESDEWSEEDERDLTLASLQRIEEEDHNPWPEDQADAQAG